MESMLEKQSPIDREVVNALIAATPETWKAAEMFGERDDSGINEKMTISISSPDGRKEPVSATVEIYSALYKLSDLFRANGPVWSTVSYKVSQVDQEDWSYSVKFEY